MISSVGLNGKGEMMFKRLLAGFVFILISWPLSGADRPDHTGGRPDACTSITVAKGAFVDGSVITSHTCDSHRTRTNLDMVPPGSHPKGSRLPLHKRVNDDSLAMPAYKFVPTGEIPQAERTHGFINTAYPCMNDKQLAVGESTFGGRKNLQSEKGFIDCTILVRLMLERCSTAREAIRLADDLTARYGYNDEGECLTIADTAEVWHFEITGPGAGNTGAIWAARRVPDGQVSVNANASRIRQLDLSRPDECLASRNVFRAAQDSGWWNPSNGPFEFCYAYDPEGRGSFAARRREWRVLSLLAPSLKLDPEAENHPFSVRPDSPVTLPKLISIFQDYYQGTEYDMVKMITSADSSGKTVISPFANPFMPYDMYDLFKINGGWGRLGERTIARWYTIYATLTQSRGWLPDPVGGVVWLAWDNVAASVYVPLYCQNRDVPPSYKINGRVRGFSRDCAWWAFNYTGTTAAQRWGDMKKDVEKVWKPVQGELLLNQQRIENQAVALYRKNPASAISFLTGYSVSRGNEAVSRCWDLGDYLWTKYDEKF
jgi:dipeptidase